MSKKEEREFENKRKQRRYLFNIFFVTLVLSATFNMLSAELIENVNSLVVSFIVLIIVMSIGVLFDIIGTAVTAADEVPFHAKASDKKKGAKESVALIKNASKVSNICSDVVGDICGVLSGATAAMIANNIAQMLDYSDYTIPTLIVTALVTAFTVWSKGLFKQFAIKNSEKIMERIGKLIAFFKFNKKASKSKKKA